jgi:hypothetical protein
MPDDSSRFVASLLERQLDNERVHLGLGQVHVCLDSNTPQQIGRVPAAVCWIQRISTVIKTDYATCLAEGSPTKRLLDVC